MNNCSAADIVINILNVSAGLWKDAAVGFRFEGLYLSWGGLVWVSCLVFCVQLLIFL